MLTQFKPDFRDIVIFGSHCTVHRTEGNKFMGGRGISGINIGKSDEIKGYRIEIPLDKIVVAIQHVRNVVTLSEKQNLQNNILKLVSSNHKHKGARRRLGTPDRHRTRSVGKKVAELDWKKKWVLKPDECGWGHRAFQGSFSSLRK